ncbi:hypothetical protein YC2023_021466 [Brassica napus]
MHCYKLVQNQCLDVDTLRGHTKNAVVYTGGNVNLHQPPWVPRHHPLLLRSPPTYTNSPSLTEATLLPRPLPLFSSLRSQPFLLRFSLREVRPRDSIASPRLPYLGSLLISFLPLHVVIYTVRELADYRSEI